MATFRHSAALGLGLTLLLAAVPTAALGQSPAPDQPPAASESLPVGLQPTGHAPLEGTTWRLRDYRHRGVERSAGPEVAAWMTLRAGTFEASGGCTRLRGRYGVMGSGLNVSLRRPRRGRCAEQTTIVQMGMVDGLRRAASYEMEPAAEPSNDQLLVRDAQGQVMLRFVPDDVAALEPGEWLLEAYLVAGERVGADPAQPAVLAFVPTRRSKPRRESSGEAVGSTGCNGIVGPYFRYADVLSFGELERTGAPCLPAMAAQEAAMVAVLDSTSLRLDLPPDGLILTSEDSGDRLEFVSSWPLEGSTWQLVRLPKTRSPDNPVTLRLADGRASGEGPCGAYAGHYGTDGVFIGFSDFTGAATDPCDDRANEERLLKAFRRTVILDRSAPGLRLLDALGRTLATFERPTGT